MKHLNFFFLFGYLIIFQSLFLSNATAASKDAEFKKKVWEVLQDFRSSEKVQTKEEKKLTTIYDDGFYLKGKDDTLKIGGWYQADIDFLLDHGHPNSDRFRNRRVRLDIRGVLEDTFEYRLYPQFAGTANLQEAWLMFKYYPNFRIKLGQFKAPFSLESQYSARWIDFVERSIGVTALQPGEDKGLMAYGKPFDGSIIYAIGAFNGRTRTNDDTNDNFDIVGRLIFKPWKSVYLGGSFTAGKAKETGTGIASYATAGGFNFATYAAATRHTGRRYRYGGELQWLYGPGDIKLEYVGATLKNIINGTSSKNLDINSGSVSVSYVLTGEQKPLNEPIRPKKNFSVKQGNWGAWEIAARAEHFSLDSTAIREGYLTGTDTAKAAAIALNWWPNFHIRGMLDFVYTKFDDKTIIGKSEVVMLTRFQYNF